MYPEGPNGIQEVASSILVSLIAESANSPYR